MSDDRFTRDPDDPTEEELLAERERRRVLAGQRSSRPTFRDVRSSVSADEIEVYLVKYCREMGIPRGNGAERVRPGLNSEPSKSGKKPEPHAPTAEDWAKLAEAKA